MISQCVRSLDHVLEGVQHVLRYQPRSDWFISNFRFSRRPFGASIWGFLTPYSSSVLSIFRSILVEFEANFDPKTPKLEPQNPIKPLINQSDLSLTLISEVVFAVTGCSQSLGVRGRWEVAVARCSQSTNPMTRQPL